MSDLLRVGASGLLAYQGALSTTSHNIANAGVEGYSRQRVGMTAQIAGSPFGSGVTLTGVSRLTDVYANSRLVDDSAGLAQQSRLSDIAARVDTLLSDSASGLGGAINAFFASAEDVAADPDSDSARAVLLGRADEFAARGQAIAMALSRLDQEIDQRAAASVGAANQLLDGIARINRDISVNPASTNDLLDERDRMVRQLAEQIGVRTAVQDGNQLNVYTRDGHALVLGAVVSEMSLVPDSGDVRRQQLAIGGGAQSVRIGVPDGGELGGLFAARTQILDVAGAQVGAVAGSVAQAVNAVQAAGTDRSGNIGAAMFTLAAPQARAYSGNNGAAEISVAFADGEPVQAGPLTLRYASGAWQLQDRASGSSIALSGTGSTGDPLRGGGLSLVVAGAPSEGDRFTLRPGADALVGLRSRPLAPGDIAAAGALTPRLPATNTGGLSVQSLTTVDAGNAAARDPASIVFDSPTQYRINGGPAQTLQADGRIAGPGWELTLSGQAAAGDSVQLQPTGALSNDNSGARALAALASGAVTSSGGTPAGAYADTVARQGVVTRQAESSRDAFARLQAADLAARESVAGVNLDEEAANLLRLQQAYQASAQVISIADNLFQTLLGAVRR